MRYRYLYRVVIEALVACDVRSSWPLLQRCVKAENIASKTSCCHVITQNRWSCDRRDNHTSLKIRSRWPRKLRVLQLRLWKGILPWFGNPSFNYIYADLVFMTCNAMFFICFSNEFQFEYVITVYIDFNIYFVFLMYVVLYCNIVRRFDVLE